MQNVLSDSPSLRSRVKMRGSLAIFCVYSDKDVTRLLSRVLSSVMATRFERTHREKRLRFR